MKKVLFTIAALAVLIGSLNAEENSAEGVGLSVKAKLDANLVGFSHTDVQNDGYVSKEDRVNSDVTDVVTNPSYDDTEIKIGYAAKNNNYGFAVGFEFPQVLPSHFAIGDVYAWTHITKYAQLKLGKYTDRVIEKIDGDKDLGVLVFDVTENEDITIESSDSLGLGAGVFGILASGYYDFPIAGTTAHAALNLFVAPDKYHRATNVVIGGYNGDRDKTHVDDYYTYKAGFSVKFTMDNLFTIGAAYRQEHTEGIEGASTGSIYHDYGIYGTTPLLNFVGIAVGAGYSGRVNRDNDREPETALVKHAIHLDLKYTGLPKLTVGLYNNISFYGLAKKYTLAYDKSIAAAANIYANEISVVVYNELSASYELTDYLVPSVKVRNYYGSLTGRNGVDGQDYGKDVLTVEGLMTFKVDKRASVYGGIKFENVIYGTPQNSVILKNSNYTVAVPIGVCVQLGL